MGKSLGETQHLHIPSSCFFHQFFIPIYQSWCACLLRPYLTNGFENRTTCQKDFKCRLLMVGNAKFVQMDNIIKQELNHCIQMYKNTKITLKLL